MSNYTKSTNFATKDNLPTGDPLKIVKGTEIDTEFNNISTAISTKTDNASAAITGGSISGITDLAIADGGTGASTATAAINNLLPSQTGNANKYLQTDGTNVSWDAISINTGDITGTLPVANGGTGVTSSTGTGSVVLSNSPTLVTPSLGAATASTLDVSGNVTLSGGTANTIPYLNGSKVVTTGTELYFNGTNLGVGASASYRVDLGSATSDDAAVGIRIGRGGSSTTWSLIDNVGGSGNYRQYSSGTPTLRWLTSTDGSSWSEQMRLNATGLGVGNNNPAAKLDITGSALVSGSVTASQFYGSFNGAIGNTTAYSGAFTSLTTSSTVTINGGTADGVAYLNGSKVLTTGSVLSFSGVHLTSNRNKDTTYSGTDYTTYANGFILNNSATPATGLFNSIYFTNNANMQSVFGVVQNSSGYGDFVWAGNSGSYAEWMRLSSSGLTLTSNPTLSGGTANGVTYLNGSKVLTSGSALTFNGTNLTLTSGYFEITGANNLYLGSGMLSSSSGALPLIFGLNATEQMRLTSTGLGIGTSSPSTKLDIAGTLRIDATSNIYGKSDNTSFVSLYGGGAYNSGAGIGLGGASQSVNPNIIIFTRGNYVETARLDSAGNLGLGVTPSAWTSIDKAFEIGRVGNGIFSGGVNDPTITSNAYYASGWKYGANGYANRLNVGSGSGAFQWFTAASGTAGNAISFTQAMTLDASGNLMVGSTSSSATANKNIDVNGTGDAALNVRVGGTTYAYLYSTAGQVILGTPASIPLTFTTAGTERARIDSSGNLLVGTTSDGGDGLSIRPRASGGGTTTQINFNRTASSTTGYPIVFQNGGSDVGYISMSNTAVGYVTSSDYRLKNTIAPMTGALAKVALLKPCTYKWNADGSDGQGFIAHELAEVVPQCVTGEKDAVDADGNPKYQGIDTSFLLQRHLI